MARKGQMFVVTAVFLVVLLSVINQALMSYTTIDISSPMQSGDHYVLRDVVMNINRTISAGGDCYQFERNLKEMLESMKSELQKDGRTLQTIYDLNCTNWPNRDPADAPLTIGITFRGASDSSGGGYDAYGVLRFYHSQ